MTLHFLSFDNNFKIPISYEPKSEYIIINSTFFNKLLHVQLSLFLRCLHKNTGTLPPHTWNNTILPLTQQHFNRDENMYKIHFPSPIQEFPMYIQFIIGNTQHIAFISSFFKILPNFAVEQEQEQEQIQIVSLPFMRLLSCNLQSVPLDEHLKRCIVCLESQTDISLDCFTWTILDTKSHCPKILHTDSPITTNSFTIVKQQDSAIEDVNTSIILSFLVPNEGNYHLLLLADCMIPVFGMYINAEQQLTSWYIPFSSNALKYIPTQNQYQLYLEEEETECHEFTIYIMPDDTNPELRLFGTGISNQMNILSHPTFHPNMTFLIKCKDSDSKYIGPLYDWHAIVSTTALF